MNIAITLKSLQLTFYTFAWDSQSEDREKDQEGEDEQNRDSKEERDSKNERDDREEKEAEGFDKEYFGKSSSFKILLSQQNGWRAVAVGSLVPPHLETIVPPPKVHS